MHHLWLQSHGTAAEIPEVVALFSSSITCTSHLETWQMITFPFEQNKEIPVSNSRLRHNNKNPGKKSSPFHISSAHRIASTVDVNS